MLTLKNNGSGEIFYATAQSAGFDICASQGATLQPGCWQVVKTGLFIESSVGPQVVLFGEQPLRCVPELQVRPRSGLAAKHGITVLNAPSTIDADYRGEIMVTLINHGREPFVIQAGDRIAQAICLFAVQLAGVPVKPVERGTGGFGSTGV